LKQLNKILLSVVITGRNDNYGGHFKERLQNSIKGLYDQLSCLEFTTELIFVNYNPLPEPPIIDFIDWTGSSSKTVVKIINVPLDSHKHYVINKKYKNVPVLEYAGKNIGIRRATGEYILCMNPDIIFPENFFLRLVPFLNKNNYLRADRIDFSEFENGKPSGFTVFHTKGHSLAITDNSAGTIAFLRFKSSILNFWRKHTEQFEWLLNFSGLKVYYDNIGYYYHLNTSGDFMLMHSSNWLKLKGYYEGGGISLHKDSLMVLQAACSGLKEVCLALPIYHKEHERRYDAQIESTENRGEYLFLQREADKMKETKEAMIYNDDDWGAASIELEEIRI